MERKEWGEKSGSISRKRGDEWTFCFARILGLVLVACVTFSCAAVYPEMATPLREPAAHQAVLPEPDEDLYYLYFAGAVVPPLMAGGQNWPGGSPDPFAKLIINGVEVLQTPVEPKSFSPTWKKQLRQNLRVPDGSKVEIEVWDSNPVTNFPICQVRVRKLRQMIEGENEILCSSGARVMLHVEPARSLLGIGLYYEVRGRDGVRVTRVASDSPASRAGLGPGDRILAVAGKPVQQLDALGVRSLMNQHSRTGVELDVWFASGKRHLVTLVEGAIYPMAKDDLQLPQN